MEEYQCTYKDGMYYSYDDKPVIIDEMGNQFWLNEYGYHRENKPAIIFQNGNKYWYNNGQIYKGKIVAPGLSSHFDELTHYIIKK